MFSRSALGIALTVALCAPTYAGAKRCPPLQIGQDEVCNCLGQNSSSKDDLGVTIVVLGLGPVTCGPSDMSPRESKNCAVTNNQFFAFCGCEVTGAAIS